MSSRHRVSRTAIELIKRFEGYRRNAAQAPSGRWTIGYGHTLTARAGASVSESDAEALLIYDLIGVAHEVNERVFTPLNQNQFDALCAFAFNIGLESFRHSNVVRRLNEGAYLQAALAMELWRRVELDGEKIVLDALVRRRAAEKTLFLTPPDGVWIPAPTPVLRAQLDMDADGLAPRHEPRSVATATQGDRIFVTGRGASAAAVVAPPFTSAGNEGPSPLQKAAVSVTSRLQAFFRGPERRATAEAPVLELTPPEPEEEAENLRRREVEPAPLDFVAANEGVQDLFEGQFSSANDPNAQVAETARLAEEATAEVETAIARPPVASPPREAGLLLLVALAAGGLALFLGGLFWFFNASGGPTAGAFTTTVAAIAAVGGVACFSVAAYQMLERLGRMAGDLGES